VPINRPPKAKRKNCPYCAETILAAAIVCKHCGRDIGAETGARAAAHANTQRTSELEGQKLDSSEVSELLASLTEKSLAIHDSETSRFRLMETVREYARDRLVDNRLGDDVRRRHLEFFVALAEEANPQSQGAQVGAWLSRLETEHDNLRAALAKCLADPDGAEIGMRLVSALCRFWWIRGYVREGRGYLEEILSHSGAQKSSANRARVLGKAGDLARRQADYSEAHKLFGERLMLFRSLDDQSGIAYSLSDLGLLAWNEGDYDSAESMLTEALAIHTNLGNKHAMATAGFNLGSVMETKGLMDSAAARYEDALEVFRELEDLHSVSFALTNLGNTKLSGNDFATAKTLYEESLAIQRHLGMAEGIANTLGNLGNLALQCGDLAHAEVYFADSLRKLLDIGDKRGIAWCLEQSARLAHAQGHSRKSAIVIGAASALRETIGCPIEPQHMRTYEMGGGAIDDIGERN
jgi:tetratricopeptide (TPR) repeat protein